MVAHQIVQIAPIHVTYVFVGVMPTVTALNPVDVDVMVNQWYVIHKNHVVVDVLPATSVLPIPVVVAVKILQLIVNVAMVVAMDQIVTRQIVVNVQINVMQMIVKSQTVTVSVVGKVVMESSVVVKMERPHVNPVPHVQT